MEILKTRFINQETSIGSRVPTHFRYNGFIYSGDFDFKITTENGLEMLHINSRNKMLFALKISTTEVNNDGINYSNVGTLVRDLIIMQRFRSSSADFVSEFDPDDKIK